MKIDEIVPCIIDLAEKSKHYFNMGIDKLIAKCKEEMEKNQTNSNNNAEPTETPKKDPNDINNSAS